MRENDGRILPAAAQEERRRIAVTMKLDGSTIKEICEAVGIAGSTVCDAWNAYKKNGMVALKAKNRGRKAGEKRHLTKEQEKTIKGKIIDRLPEQLKLDFALWTRGAVMQLIEQKTGIDMPIRTVGEYLKRWGFTPQKPLKYAYERKPEAVQKWLEVEFPQIKRKAAREKAEIYWGDETGLRAGDVRGRGFAPKGETPVINVTAKYENVSMISAITNQGKVHWMFVDGAVNIGSFLDFLKRLVKVSRRKVYLILDNLKVHHSKEVTQWVKDREDRIALFYLPAYNPDLNPDEHLNADLKQGIGSRAPNRSKKSLADAAHDHLRMLKASPGRIRKYSKDPAISYAAI